jgi:hypothetical protein
MEIQGESWRKSLLVSSSLGIEILEFLLTLCFSRIPLYFHTSFLTRVLPYASQFVFYSSFFWYTFRGLVFVRERGYILALIAIPVTISILSLTSKMLEYDISLNDGLLFAGYFYSPVACRIRPEL